MSEISGSQIRELMLPGGRMGAAHTQRSLLALFGRGPSGDGEDDRIPDLVQELLERERAGSSFTDAIDVLLAASPVRDTENHASARQAMGNGFLGLPELDKAYDGPAIDEGTLCRLRGSVPFRERTLLECRGSHALVAYPGWSVEQMHRHIKSPRTNFWCSHLSGKIASAGRQMEQLPWRAPALSESHPHLVEQGEPRWYLVRRSLVFPTGDTGTWEDARANVGGHERPVPWQVVLYAAILLQAVRGERILLDQWAMFHLPKEGKPNAALDVGRHRGPVCCDEGLDVVDADIRARSRRGIAVERVPDADSTD